MSREGPIRTKYRGYGDKHTYQEGTQYKDGEEVTVTMNGCRANGVIDTNAAKESPRMGGSQAYGNSSLRDADTGETIYKVRITSGPNKGLVYTAHESQLEHGWHADALGNTCDGDGSSVSESASDAAINKLIMGGLLFVVIAGVIYLGIRGRGPRLGFA